MTSTTPSPTALASRREEFRAVLLRHRAECETDLAAAASAAAEDALDPVASARCEALRDTLADIDAALARLAAGTYGTCVHCGAAIPEGRLELRPYAASCVPCLERLAHHPTTADRRTPGPLP